jgi:hypothetical protein
MGLERGKTLHNMCGFDVQILQTIPRFGILPPLCVAPLKNGHALIVKLKHSTHTNFWQVTRFEFIQNQSNKHHPCWITKGYFRWHQQLENF